MRLVLGSAQAALQAAPPKWTSLAVAFFWLCGDVSAQEMAQLTCRGILGDYQAELSGARIYTPYNQLGDGYVRFEGTVKAGGIAGQIVYEGYTRTAPFHGLISGPNGSISIVVLDNTGGALIIYSGQASLKA